jgi:signal transduction histidine kinase
MYKMWNYISSLGITSGNRHIDERTVVLTNQLNFIMFVSMLILLITTVVTMLLTHDNMSLGTLRVAVLMFVSILNLVFARFGFVQLSRLSLIFLPPVVFILGPTIGAGYVEEESYTYYPYLLICTSIVCQLLVNPRNEKYLFWFSLFYYFTLTVVIDILMFNFGEEHFPIIDRIRTFYPFYKIAQIALFLFLNACIYYLRMLNFRYEEELSTKNSELYLQNIELKGQKEKIEKQKDELVAKEVSTWQKLVSIITHEIVNSAIPITNLAGMTGQMLEDESGGLLKPEQLNIEATEDIHHGLKIIESRTKSLVNFVKATKSISDIPVPSIRKILISELLDRITILFIARFKESGIRLETRIIPADLSVEADLELIEQVLINIIQNAIEAMHNTSDRRILINAGLDEVHQVTISVSDNGPGISSEMLERIFLPFYSTKENNSGIGLSLSSQIMLQHHGRLEVSSEPGKGARFILVF